MNKPFLFIAVAAAIAGCSGGAPPFDYAAGKLAKGDSSLPYMQAGTVMHALSGTGAGKIKHVVWVVQENRSFNDIFEGYPGAKTASSGKDSHGNTIQLQPVSLKTGYDIDHSAAAMFEACNGTGSLPGTNCRMNGFNNESEFGGPKNGQYVYVPHSESKPYWDMANEWVLADNMFATQLDESFVAHQYIIAGQAQSSVDVPFGPWGCDGGSGDVVQTITQQRTIGNTQVACFDYQTLGDELDTAGLSWRFYTSKYSKPLSGLWSAYQAVKHIYEGPDWKKDIITPQKRFLTDVKAGKLASMTWVTPLCPDSDHLNCGGGFGPSWVSSVVNAVGESKFWDSTVVFVQWDDWGGVYDPVPPPFEDYDGNGFRVGLIVISAYAKSNYVSHKQYETASVMRFAEDLFGLGQLSAADARATSPAADCLDFSQKPRKFVPIKSPQNADFFLRQPNDGRIPDDDK
ncbi:MAG TPA: alkaline phosphatase family protein [Candidatus Nitrosotalea sp.]|nr:alkaline phosphatase family protein [Candidatus Nitrosotalea sp.]